MRLPVLDSFVARHEFGLEGIFDNVRDGLILVRFPRQEIVLFNRAASETLGIAIDEAIGARLDQVFSDEHVRETARLCSTKPVGVWPGHAQEVYQTHVRTGPGHAVDVELHFCRVDDVGLGGPLVLLVMRPRSEVVLEDAVRKEEAARRRIAALEKDARDHALFFSAAAHEFNTPLTVVALQAELLRGALGPVVPVQERALRIINANVHRLVLLSQDLVDLARADAGRLLLRQVPVDLFQLAKDEVANFHALASQQRLTVDLLAVGESPTVLGDPARLRQVLSNLLGNAIKFTPPGGRIVVETASDQGTASVRIRDTGPGMDAEDQARLFRPFVRIDCGDALKKPGTGLGLYLCKRIVEAHGGQVGCSSPGRGQGMTFWFTLPLAAAAGLQEDVTVERGFGTRPPRAGRPEHEAARRRGHDGGGQRLRQRERMSG